MQYHRFLLELTPDCEQRRRINDLFTLNRVSDFETLLTPIPLAPLTPLSSDSIMVRTNFDEPLFERIGDTNVFEPAGSDRAQFVVRTDPGTLRGAATRFNLAPAGASGSGFLSDDLRLRDGATVTLNHPGPLGWPDGNQTAPTGATFTVSLCGRLRLLLADEARLELGHPTQGNTADTRVEDGGLLELQNRGRLVVNTGSVLRVQPGATLVVRNGATVEVNGQLRIESGGFLCVEQGANLVFAPAAQLYVDAGATLGVPAGLVLDGGAVTCSPELSVCGLLTGNNPNVVNTATRNEALVFDGTDDVVTIPNTNSFVNNLGAQFAVEAFVRPDNLLRGGSQVLFSNRRDNGAKTYGVEGAMLTLADGYLLLQLDGVNFGYGQAATLLPNDGGCHHVAVSRDAGNRLRFFIDGQFVYTPASTTSRLPTSSGPLSLGADNRSGFSFAEFFPGLLGEVRVWNTSRTDAQIQQNITTRLAPQAGLVAYYDMQDATGPQLGDGSGGAASGNALSPGTLGAPGSGNPDQPSWLSACALSCTVQGNMRAGVSASDAGPPQNGAIGDTLGNRAQQLATLGQKTGTAALLTQLRVSPNPAAGAASLRFELTTLSLLDIRILDLTGTERASLHLTPRAVGPQEIALPVRDLPPGLYLIAVEGKHGRQLVRLQLF